MKRVVLVAAMLITFLVTGASFVLPSTVRADGTPYDSLNNSIFCDSGLSTVISDIAGHPFPANISYAGNNACWSWQGSLTADGQHFVLPFEIVPGAYGGHIESWFTHGDGSTVVINYAPVTSYACSLNSDATATAGCTSGTAYGSPVMCYGFDDIDYTQEQGDPAKTCINPTGYGSVTLHLANLGTDPAPTHLYVKGSSVSILSITLFDPTDDTSATATATPTAQPTATSTPVNCSSGGLTVTPCGENLPSTQVFHAVATHSQPVGDCWEYNQPVGASSTAIAAQAGCQTPAAGDVTYNASSTSQYKWIGSIFDVIGNASPDSQWGYFAICQEGTGLASYPYDTSKGNFDGNVNNMSGFAGIECSKNKTASPINCGLVTNCNFAGMGDASQGYIPGPWYRSEVTSNTGTPCEGLDTANALNETWNVVVHGGCGNANLTQVFTLTNAMASNQHLHMLIWGRNDTSINNAGNCPVRATIDDTGGYNTRCPDSASTVTDSRFGSTQMTEFSLTLAWNTGLSAGPHYLTYGEVSNSQWDFTAPTLYVTDASGTDLPTDTPVPGGGGGGTSPTSTATPNPGNGTQVPAVPLKDCAVISSTCLPAGNITGTPVPTVVPTDQAPNATACSIVASSCTPMNLATAIAPGIIAIKDKLQLPSYPSVNTSDTSDNNGCFIGWQNLDFNPVLGGSANNNGPYTTFDGSSPDNAITGDLKTHIHSFNWGVNVCNIQGVTFIRTIAVFFLDSVLFLSTIFLAFDAINYDGGGQPGSSGGNSAPVGTAGNPGGVSGP